MPLRRLALLALGAVSGELHAQAPAAGVPSLPDIVIGSTALPGTGVDADHVPAFVATLQAAPAPQAPGATIADAIAARLAGAAIDDSLGDDFQPTLVYRGFSASPLLGTAQGIAVYQNGARINEAFGDAVNWDLVPLAAVERLEVVGANPVYGLNALGAAVVLGMKNGFGHSGGEIALTGGSFGARGVTLENGLERGRFAAYLAAHAADTDGWRRFGGDRVRQLYLDAAYRAERVSVDASLTVADNELGGQGAAPLQQLAVDRTLTFTGPQKNSNRLAFATLLAAWNPAPATALQASAYRRHFRQQIHNGNTSGYVRCGGVAPPGLLCQDDAATRLFDTRGRPVPDLSNGGAAPLGEDDFESIDAHSTGIAVQAASSKPLAGRPNHFVAGAAFDAARVGFAAGAELGAIDERLIVQPSGIVVSNPEGTAFRATPVALAARNRYSGLYATDTLELSSRLTVTASLRLNSADVILEDRRGEALSGRNHYRRANPAFGATLKLTPAVTVYAGYAETNRTPTASEIECSDPERPCLLPSTLAGDPPALRQVVARTVELGVRGHAATDAAAAAPTEWYAGAFRADLGDDIAGVASERNGGYYRNIGATRRLGIEAGIAGHAPRLNWYLSAAALEATYRSALVIPSPSSPYRDANGNIAVRPGDRLPGIPRWRLAAGADCSVSARLTAGIVVGAAGTSVLRGDEANLGPALGGYVTVGLHASYRPSPRAELWIRLDNATDARYASAGLYGDPTGVGAAGIPAGATRDDPRVDHRFVTPGRPRTATAGFRLRY